MKFTTQWTVDIYGEDTQISLSTTANAGESQADCIARHMRRVRTYLDTATFKPKAGTDMHTWKEVGLVSDLGVHTTVGSDWLESLTTHTYSVLGTYQ